jgi:hypothetical protein
MIMLECNQNAIILPPNLQPKGCQYPLRTRDLTDTCVASVYWHCFFINWIRFWQHSARALFILRNFCLYDYIDVPQPLFDHLEQAGTMTKPET